MEGLEGLKTNVCPERRQGGAFSKVDEEATESFELEKRLTLKKRMRDQLTEIEHALHKFELGTYGLCDICSQPIKPDR
jgi:RNA polymerase-binding transcription factor DksA